MRPSDLLGMQADFLRRYGEGHDNPDTRMMKVQVTAIDRSIRAKEEGVPVDETNLSQVIREGRYPPMAEGAVQNAASAARGGMPIMVSPQMVDLITWVANDFPDTEAVDLAIAPSPYGFVWLDKPYHVTGAVDRGEGRVDPDTEIDLMVWSPLPQAKGGGPHAVTFLGFNAGIRPDPVTVRWTANSKRDGFRGHPYNLCFVSALIQGERVGERDWGPMFCRPMVYEAAPGDENRIDGFGDPVHEGERLMEYATWNGPNVQRWLYALWVVMGQEIADVRQEQADRATKRRMARMKLPPAITVITLRRPANPHRHEGDGHVEWQHHWYVRGHPRWQACGPGRQERKLIWIRPFVKGNLDAPLRQSEKVYRVSR